MKRWSTLFFVLAIALSLPLRAQVFNDLRKVGPALKLPPKLSVGLESRRSFISSVDVKVMGLKASLDFDRRVRMGFGVYFLASAFNKNFIRNDIFGQVDTVNARLQFTYLTGFFEYVILSTKRWELSLPIHLGIGDVGFQGIGEEPKTVLLSESSLMASYKIFPFFGLAGGVGYRQMLLGGDLIRENFNSPTYSFGLKFWMGYLYEKLIKNRKKPTI